MNARLISTRLFIIHVGSLILVTLFLRGNEAQAQAATVQSDSLSLVVENRKSHEEILLHVGEAIRYKTTGSQNFEKRTIEGFTPSSISFGQDVNVRFDALVSLSVSRYGRRFGGTALIVAGVASLAIGIIAQGIAGSHIGSGESDPGAVAAMVGGAAALISGILVRQEKKIDLLNTWVIKTVPKTVTAALLAKEPKQRKLKAGVGLGYSTSGGVALYFEPMLRVVDNFAVGIKYESVMDPAKTKSLSFVLQGYFTKQGVRPFIGLGGGYYSYDGWGDMAIYPRIGLDFNHFNFTVDYNLIPAQDNWIQPDPNLYSSGYYVHKDYSYVGFKIGYTFGGGTK